MIQLPLTANEATELKAYTGITPDLVIIVGGYSSPPFKAEIWQYNAFSLLPDNNVSVLKPTDLLETDPGRFIRTSSLIEDFATDNLTTNELSLLDLNTAYPETVNGFRVHCNSITTGALIYEKTASGWVSFPVTVVV